MDLNEIQNNLIGEWTGDNLLFVPWLTPPESLSQSSLSVVPVAKGRFLTFSYTWEYEGAAHEGLLLLGCHEGIATAAWVDSWHMSAKIMNCQGAIDEKGVIGLRGTYEAPPGPDWGWRITISSDSGEKLQILMYNCTPEGAEELAVRANYVFRVL